MLATLAWERQMRPTTTSKIGGDLGAVSEAEVSLSEKRRYELAFSLALTYMTSSLGRYHHAMLEKYYGCEHSDTQYYKLIFSHRLLHVSFRTFVQHGCPTARRC